MNFDKNIKEMIEYPAGGILSKEVVRSDKMDVTLFCMAAGKKISDHTSKKQGFVYVVEGDGIFTLEGKEILMRPGVFIFMEENAVHALEAIKNTSFILALT